MLIYSNQNSNQYNDISSESNEEQPNSQYEMTASATSTEFESNTIEEEMTEANPQTKTEYFSNTITASYEYKYSISYSDSKTESDFKEEEITKTTNFGKDSFTMSNDVTTNIKIEFTTNSKYLQDSSVSKIYSNLQSSSCEFTVKSKEEIMTRINTITIFQENYFSYSKSESEEENNQKEEISSTNLNEYYFTYLLSEAGEQINSAEGKISNSYLKEADFPYPQTQNKKKGSNNLSLIIGVVIGIIAMILIAIIIIIIFIKKRHREDTDNDNNDQPKGEPSSTKTNYSAEITMQDISNRNNDDEDDLNFWL